MKKLLVTIIIPSYNSENYIAKSVLSVLAQTYKNIELIIVNDGSNDSTQNVILEIMKTDNRIKYFEIENSGVSVARNVGLKYATGDYVGFVDSDDYIENEMIEQLVRHAEKFTCDIVSCTYERVYSDKKIPENTLIRSGYYDKKDIENIIYPNLFGNEYIKSFIPLNIVTKIYRREIIEKYDIRFRPNLKFGEDILFSQEFFLRTASFYFIGDSAFYKYVHNDFSATSIYQQNKWLELKKNIQIRKKIIKEFLEFDFRNQISYLIVSSSVNAVINVGKNKDRSERLKELSSIVTDKELITALASIDIKKIEIKFRVLICLMKYKNIYALNFLVSSILK